MHISYNPEHNIGYIRFKKAEGKVAKTLCISDDFFIDMAADGTIYGVELLNANEQLKGLDASIVFENQHTHQRQEFLL